MSQDIARTFSRAFKLKAISRMDAGENVSALSRELEVKREILYRWRSQFRAGGEERLRERRGRPTVKEALMIAAARRPAGEAADLAAAQQRIADLERKIGRQQLDLDFFKGALRHIEALRQASDQLGVTASSPKSRR
jgi:transposase-like protein